MTCAKVLAIWKEDKTQENLAEWLDITLMYKDRPHLFTSAVDYQEYNERGNILIIISCIVNKCKKEL